MPLKYCYSLSHKNTGKAKVILQSLSAPTKHGLNTIAAMKQDFSCDDKSEQIREDLGKQSTTANMKQTETACPITT